MKNWVRLLLAAIGGGVVVLVVEVLLLWLDDTTSHRLNFGDVPTWFTFAAAAGAAVAALVQLDLQRRQLKEQQKVIAKELERQEKRDKLMDAQLRDLRSAEAAREAAEKERLKPKLEVHMRPGGEGSSENATLVVRHLTESPSPVIDRLTIEVRNEQPDRPNDGPVWGPWKMKAGADGADSNGRAANHPESLERGYSIEWTLERTDDPNLVDDAAWRTAQHSKNSLFLLTAYCGTWSWEYSIDTRPGLAPQRL